MKDTKPTWGDNYIVTFGDEGIMVYKREEFGYPSANPMRLWEFLDYQLAKQRHDLKGQVLEDGGPTIDEVEQWLNKLDLLTSRGSKIVHVKHLLMKYRQRIEAVFAKEE